MSKRYTREQLIEMGMDEAQINAILSTYAKDENENKVVPIAGHSANQPVNCDQPINITSLADLQKYAKGTIVRLPDFAEGQPFVARLRRPSMLVLAKQGKIPNSLLSAAGELFSKGGEGLDADNENMLSDVYDICKIICSASLVEPTMDEIESAGITLSDDQLMAIFNYTQSGVKALESFREE